MKTSIFVLFVLLAFWLISKKSGYNKTPSSSNLNAISYGGSYTAPAFVSKGRRLRRYI